LEALVRESSLCSLTADQALFSQGNTADAMFVVLEGRLAVTVLHDGSSFLVGKIGPGDPVGEMQVVAGGHRTATVTAESYLPTAASSQRVPSRFCPLFP